MAWNKYYIVITNQTEKDHQLVKDKLGLDDYKEKGAAYFGDTNKSDDLFIGYYEDKLIIADPDLPLSLFSENASITEQKFIAAFPDCEIAALVENSTVGEFGYAIIVNGQRIRAKHGCDGEIYIDIGNELPEEQTILSGNIFDAEEIEEMREYMDEEEIKNAIAFEASWRTPGDLSARYFGMNIEELPEHAIKMIHYKK